MAQFQEFLKGKDKEIASLRAKLNLTPTYHVDLVSLIVSNEEKEKVMVEKIKLQKENLELKNSNAQLKSHLEAFQE